MLTTRATVLDRIAAIRSSALQRVATPNVTRTAAAANPQLSPTRAALVPGRAPLVASPLRPTATLPPAPGPSFNTPVLKAPSAQVPDMSLLGRIGGAIKGAAVGFVTGGPGGALSGGVRGATSSAGPRRPGAPSVALALPSACPGGTIRGPLGSCVDLMPGGQTTGGGIFVTQGEAVMARYGAALAPQRKSLTIRTCPRGAVLANDGYCYNKSQLAKRDRMWVPGRKPLLTGGDLNAITRAHRAATRIEAQTKRLQGMGMMKKPTPARARRAPPRSGGHQGGITVVDT